MAGGIVFGTLLAMMRLSSMKPVVHAGRRLRQPDALDPAGAGHLLVLLSRAVHRRLVIGAKQRSMSALLVGGDHLYHVRGRVLLRDHARRHPVDSARPVWSGYALGLDYWQTMARIVLPQAFRNMLPVLLTQTIILFQDTSLVYVISATISWARREVANRDYAWSNVHFRRRGVFHRLVRTVFLVSGSRTHRDHQVGTMISIKNVSKWYGSLQVLTRCSPK